MLAHTHDACRAAAAALLTPGNPGLDSLGMFAVRQSAQILGGVGTLLAGAGAATVAVLIAFRRRIARTPPAVPGENRDKTPTAEGKIGNETQAEISLFQVAAETALNAFYILESVRGDDGAVEDFRFRYMNAQGEKRLQRTRQYLVGKRLCQEFPWMRDVGLFDRYCEVVESGVAFSSELEVLDPTVGQSWVRHQVVKLGDGIGLTSSDLSALKAIEQRHRELARFNDSIFENAPYSMIAADAEGTITAMNLEAERLTGYRRADLVGRRSVLMLHDPDELQLRSEQLEHDLGICLEGVELITMRSDDGEAHEEEWTYVRRDGTRSPVNLAVKVLYSTTGERQGLIGIAQDATRMKHRTSYATSVMTHDPLTGLVGRSLLEDRMSQAIERAKRMKTKVAVFVIDLDHFRRINDSMGHRVGDEILNLAAARLVKTVRSSDTVSRLGGDEFVVVMPDQKGDGSVKFCAEKLRRAVSSPYLVQGNQVVVTASVGYCTYPDLAASVEDLMERTDAAMHMAKQAGRNRFQIFTAAMLEEASSRVSMEGALRLAFDRDELFLHYQPQVALPGGKVIGMEALLRWKHPQLGLVSPAHFIPMAEELGLMPDFGAWVIRQACHEAKQLQDRLGRRLMLSVNLSPHQFQPHQPQDKRLVKVIEEALQSSGLPAPDLEIEITENTLMINSTANLQTLQAIRDLGVRLSIDDFGTGFSSFSYLLQYHVDRLKIDQSFVRQAVVDANAAAVVRSIIAMSHGLNIKVIAEGVETPEQLKFLMRRRCDEAQGYYFSRAVGVGQFVEMVRKIEAMHFDETAQDGATLQRRASEEFLKQGAATETLGAKRG